MRDRAELNGRCRVARRNFHSMASTQMFVCMRAADPRPSKMNNSLTLKINNKHFNY
jgi:hypothetical protein